MFSNACFNLCGIHIRGLALGLGVGVGGSVLDWTVGGTVLLFSIDMATLPGALLFNVCPVMLLFCSVFCFL